MVHRRFGEFVAIEEDLAAGSSEMNGIRVPTDAEVEARRRRTDEISRIMGEYLLKGYKMLATYCDRCSNILMEDRSGNTYCIACEEVDKEPEPRADISVDIDDTPQIMQIPLEQSAQSNSSAKYEPAQAIKPTSSEKHLDRASLYLYQDALNAIEQKLQWATNELRSETEPKRSEQLIYVIKAAIETLKAFK